MICWGMVRQGFDLCKDPVLQDVTLLFGFISALGYVLRIRFRGLNYMALPCNSFSFMTSSQHQRTWNSPYGSPCFPWIHLGNCICSRSCILALVAIARSVAFFIENPLQSALQRWPFVNYLMGLPWLNSHRTSWSDP